MNGGQLLPYLLNRNIQWTEKGMSKQPLNKNVKNVNFLT